MKKPILYAAAALLAAAALPSCKPDDEIYNRECKISKIWYRSNVGAPDEIFKYDDKGMLSGIEADSALVFKFTYNKDKTVANIVHAGEDYTETVDMTYTDRLVSRIVYTVDDTVRMEADITRDEETGRIATVTENYDKMFFDRYAILYKCPLFGRFVGDVSTVSVLASEAPSKALTLRCTKVFTYFPGEKKKYENMESVVEDYPDLQKKVRRTYTYDSGIFNPFYGLPYAYADYAGYSLNCRLTETETVTTAGHETGNTTVKYDYSGRHYLNDKQYPREFVAISSVNNIPIHTYILYLK